MTTQTTKANTTRKLARDLAPGDVMRFMARPAQILGVTAPWTRGNHTYVTITFLDEGDLEHLEFIADKERTVLTRDYHVEEEAPGKLTDEAAHDYLNSLGLPFNAE